jgi:hypothetical protein
MNGLEPTIFVCPECNRATHSGRLCGALVVCGRCVARYRRGHGKSPKPVEKRAEASAVTAT